jgi:DNA-binding transcriptional ArsR family regulator
MKEADALAALSALAQETRLRLFRLLVAAGPDGLPAGRIAGELGAPESTLSFHLSQLKAAGLIQARRQGRSLIYSGDFGAMNALVEFLTETCCGGRPELCCPPTPNKDR